MARAADTHGVPNNPARRAAQSPELPVGDEAAGEFEKGFMHVGPAFPANSQAPEAVQPGKRPLDQPPVGAQTTAVPGTASSDRRDEATSSGLITVDVMVIAAVREQRVGLAALSSVAATDGRAGDTSTPMLLARSRHASVRALERYARPGVAAVARHVAERDSAARRRR